MRYICEDFDTYWQLLGGLRPGLQSFLQCARLSQHLTSRGNYLLIKNIWWNVAFYYCFNVLLFYKTATWSILSFVNDQLFFSSVNHLFSFASDCLSFPRCFVSFLYTLSLLTIFNIPYFWKKVFQFYICFWF